MSDVVEKYKVQLRAFTEGNALGTELNSKDEVSKAIVSGYENLHAAMAINGEIQILLSPVDSSNISHVGWLPEFDDAPSEMFVVFKNSGIYGYLKVELAKYLTFMNSDSKGKYLNSQIKPSYDFTRYL